MVKHEPELHTPHSHKCATRHKILSLILLKSEPQKYL